LLRVDQRPAFARLSDEAGVTVAGLGHRCHWRLGLEPYALNPCRYRAFVGDCIRGTGNVAILLPCSIGTKSENAGTIEGEEQRLSVWRVVNDDWLQTKFNSALFQRQTTFS
jgi:hypothetical protein